MDFAVQATGIVAMCAIIISFQFKSKTTLLLSQCVGAVKSIEEKGELPE